MSWIGRVLVIGLELVLALQFECLSYVNSTLKPKNNAVFK